MRRDKKAQPSAGRTVQMLREGGRAHVEEYGDNAPSETATNRLSHLALVPPPPEFLTGEVNQLPTSVRDLLEETAYPTSTPAILTPTLSLGVIFNSPNAIRNNLS